MNGVSSYLSMVSRIPVLTAEQEREIVLAGKVDKLAHHYLPLATGVAMRYSKMGFPLDELFSAAHLGLMHAARRYQSENGPRFMVYAKPWVEGEIKLYLRNSFRARARETSCEISREIPDREPLPDATMANKEKRDLRKKAFSEVIKRLTDRELIVIKDRYKEKPRKLKDLAVEMGVSHTRITQIEAKALNKLRRGMML